MTLEERIESLAKGYAACTTIEERVQNIRSRISAMQMKLGHKAPPAPSIKKQEPGLSDIKAKLMRRR